MKTGKVSRNWLFIIGFALMRVMTNTHAAKEPPKVEILVSSTANVSNICLASSPSLACPTSFFLSVPGPISIKVRAVFGTVRNIDLKSKTNDILNPANVTKTPANGCPKLKEGDICDFSLTANFDANGEVNVVGNNQVMATFTLTISD